ncbi:MAG TPA: GxxExxY protein [bacterium]|nr:GxxExxY protein [bacterium]
MKIRVKKSFYTDYTDSHGLKRRLEMSLIYEEETYKMILEVKAVEQISKGHLKQSLNYLAASKMKLSLVVNFGEDSFNHKRVIF